MQLYERPGWGSAIIEAQLAILGLNCDLILSGDLYSDPMARARIAALNPLVQIPTLVLDDGQVMTESAAITLYLSELAGSTLLVPPPGDPLRPAFLRWLIFIVANVYPCFTLAEVPTRFVAEAEAEAFKSRVTDHATSLWQVMATEAEKTGGPWFFGPRFTALDIYLAVMVHWRPRRAAFETETPILAAIAARATARPDMAAVMERNFPP